MNWGSWLLWGVVATLVMGTAQAMLQGMGVTRMNLPYMLGTFFTPDRDRARLYGFVAFVLTGWLFSLLYVAVFQSMGAAGWLRGTIIGLIHAAFVLTVGVSLLPGLHPRMASEQQGPEPGHELEPPGFLALHYGIRTPLAIAISHAIFGMILGAFYHLK